jgi:prophage regulatory protein
MVEDRILREAEVARVTGLSRVTRWRHVRTGRFPAPIVLGERAIGWRASAVQAWIESRRTTHPLPPDNEVLDTPMRGEE